MNKYWLLVRNSSGMPMRIIITADNPFLALEQAKAMYGDKLISEGANAC